MAVPGDAPPARPVELTVATVVLLLLQVPPGVMSLNKEVAPVHTLVMPVMPAVDGTTVTVV
jgi:hypothetical protein